MKRKIIISILTILIMMQSIVPIKVSAMEEVREIVSVPAKIEHQKTSDVGFVDTMVGLVLEPTVEFFTVIIDAIMSVFEHLMMPSDDGLKFVMVSNIQNISDIGQPSATFTINDLTSYKNGFDQLDVRYPNFIFSTEDIFAGKSVLLNVDFISGNDSEGKVITDNSWVQIRNVVSQWYKVLRMIAIIGLLSMLIYTGIKIILASTAVQKAKYKEMLANWFIAVVLVFAMHYIMAFIMTCISTIMSMLEGVGGVIKVSFGDKSFNTNLLGLARFQMQQNHFSAKISYLIIYTALSVYTLKFTFVYLKRVLYMAFLTIISPVVALTYPLDKMDGKARGFEMWLKEYMYNALLQPMHYILYYILVISSLTLAAKNPIYAIIAISFVSQGEKLLKQIFGIDKAKEGTVGGIARSFTTGAMVGALNNMVRLPAGKRKKKKDGKGSKNGKNKDSDDFLLHPGAIYENDWREFDDPASFSGAVLNSGNNAELQEEPQAEEAQAEQTPLDRYLADGYGTNVNGEYFNPYTDEYEPDYNPEKDPMYMGENERNRMEALQRYYVDGYGTNANGEYFNPYTDEYDPDYDPTNDPMYIGNAGILPDQPQPEPQSQQKHEPEPQQEDTRDPIREKGGVGAGLAAVGKKLAKPIWDFDKNGQYNGKRFVRRIAKGVLGTAVGITAAAVQAGISITDGKYKPMEGVATFAAGYVGGAGIVDGIERGIGGLVNTYREGAAGDDKDKLREIQMRRAQQRFADRDDVIAFNKKEYPTNPKAAMERQRNNYLTRGITELDQMNKCMKYADTLIQQKGMSAEDADRRAAATFEFRQKLQERGQLESVYNKKKQDKYIEVLVKKDVEEGLEENMVKRRYLNAYDSVREFDAANR